MSEQDQANAVQPGDVVAGKYRVDRVLGVGGMGVVVAATHEQLDQKVALKFLHPELVDRADVAARFLREARAAVRIRSEHVARVLDVGSLENGAPYMVMEFLEGEDLEHALQRGPLAEATAVGYLLEACEAIAEAHSVGIVHRDLKPANLFLARGPSGGVTVKVLDFGISKAPLSDKEKALTQEATLMGTPAYMSPEQMRAARTVDARSDIWALGVILHELVTGSAPFQGDSMATLVTGVLAMPHPRATVGGASASPLQHVIDRCLEKDAERRYANVGELAEALVPFGPPRGEQSLERISAVLGRAPGDRSSAVLSAPAGSRSSASDPMYHATVAVTTGPGGSPTPTLTPTVRSSGGGAGRLVVPAILIGVAIVASASIARLRRPSDERPTPLANATETGVVATPVPPEAPSQAPTASPRPTVAPATPIPSTSAEAAEAPGPMASASATALFGRFKHAGHASAPSAPSAPSATATAAATAATAAPAPPPPAPCKVVSYYDAEGTKHFRKDCP